MIKPQFVLWLAATLCAAQALAAEPPPEMSDDGLVLIDSPGSAVVYAQPDADLSGYRRVAVLEPYVAFRKNWQRDQNRGTANRVSSSDMERIRRELSAEFMKVFTEVLSADDGFEIVSVAGPDVLVLRPAIVNLNPTAPDLNSPGRTSTYAESAGEMTLLLEIFDSETGDLIARAIDRKVDRGTGFATWQTRSSNRAAANRALREWASALRAGLERAREQGAEAG